MVDLSIVMLVYQRVFFFNLSELIKTQGNRTSWCLFANVKPRLERFSDHEAWTQEGPGRAAMVWESSMRKTGESW